MIRIDLIRQDTRHPDKRRRDMLAQAAGRVTETDSPRPENARTAATHPSDGPEHPQGQDDASAGVVGPQTPVAA